METTIKLDLGQRYKNQFIQLVKSPVGRAFIALFLVLLLGAIFNADGAFLKYGTHRDTLRQASVYGILACGMTLVIISGGIDLAVGSILGVSSVTFALMSIHFGWPAWICIIGSLFIGAICGSISGTLTAWARVQPFIATLAMLVFARGVAKWITDGKKVASAVPNGDGTWRFVELPELMQLIDSTILGGNLSIVTIIFFICAILTMLLLSRHRWGRQLYAIGGNEEAARLSGVNVNLTKMLAYTASGMLAAVAGICQAAQEQQGDPEAGSTYELTAIAMVVIGGTNLMGGRGSIGLTILGILTIGYVEKILSINAVPEAGRLMITGVIIVLAVLTQTKKAN